MLTEATFSRALNRTKRASVVLPSGYGSRGRRYPTLFLLHGHGGNRHTWLQQSALLRCASSLDLIIVLPESGRYWFINDHGGRRYEDYLVGELLPTVDRRFRTVSDRHARAIAGFSSGGAAALFQTLRHPDRFSVSASFAGAFEAPLRVGDPYAAQRGDPALLMPTVESHERVWGPPGSPSRRTYEPYRLIETWAGRPPVRLYLDVGIDDLERVVRMSRNVHRAMADRGIPHAYHERPGGHDWSYVNRALPFALAFIVEHLRWR